MTVGVLRRSVLPRFPTPVLRPSAHPFFGSWHVAQLISLSPARRLSKKTSRPSSIMSRLADPAGGSNGASLFSPSARAAAEAVAVAGAGATVPAGGAGPEPLSHAAIPPVRARAAAQARRRAPACAHPASKLIAWSAPAGPGQAGRR